MPLYEYRCQTCGEKRTAIRPMSQSDEDLVEPCVDRPGSCLEMESGLIDQTQCVFKRILSPTPTDFRHNDFTGYDGLEKRRSMWDKKT